MVKNYSGEKSVFQCFDCKSIMKFHASDLLLGDTYIKLKDDDVVFTSNQFSLPYTVLVVSKIPFCPFCKGRLVLLYNRLLDKFHEYLKIQGGEVPALMLTLPSFLDKVLDIFESVQRGSVIPSNKTSRNQYIITQAGKDIFGHPFDTHEDALEELRVFIADKFDVKIDEWNDGEI